MVLTLVAEQDEEYAAVISATLRRENHRVIIASSPTTAAGFTERQQPDLAVLSATPPDRDALDLASALRGRWPALPIVFVSPSQRTSDIIACFSAGGDEYITKPFHPGEFIARVRAVVRRAGEGRATKEAAPATPVALTGHGLEFDDTNCAAYFDQQNLHCTQLEFQILKLMDSARGQVLSHSFMNEQIWRYSNLHDGTLLKGHVSALRRKLRAAGGDEHLIRTVHGVGYSLAAS